MKIKIVSDGTSVGTKIVDVETGKAITNVSAITWHAEANEVETEATLVLSNVPVELIGKVKKP